MNNLIVRQEKVKTRTDGWGNHNEKIVHGRTLPHCVMTHTSPFPREPPDWCYALSKDSRRLCTAQAL